MRSKPASLGTQHSELGTFVWPVRVYYEDSDAGGVVYYANYLCFLERARTEWLRALGLEQTDLAAVHQLVFVVRSIALDYLKPARFNDALEVTVEPGEIGASRIRLSQRVRRGAEELLAARVELACVNTETFKPVRIPRTVAESLARHGPYQKSVENMG
ncbi:MAG: tol-pal system-associated acyl-CoA thioesterase [Betaproteobacteria bacterium]|nr:tol-pal system-associated acyl-CoA thioesterase [Betaproteobacteria bacterium]